ncbi:MAG: choice-of-anchor tandem repeat GloVer-containing protein [Candidatus Cybelea sp.]
MSIEMTIVTLSRYGFVVCAVAALLVGCGGASTPLSPSLSQVTTESAHALDAFDVLYSFQGAPKDGEDPNEALVNVNGTMYGTTSSGGKHGAGTVLAITTSGKETILYGFKGGSADGAAPSAPLINVNGTLYGATSYAGAHDKGVIFAITTSGTETVLYSFKGGSADGSNPSGALLNVNGTLYGTTVSGGSRSCGGGGCGTVFSITTSGKEVVRYNFKGGKTDGQSPNGGLVNVHGKLYGTTNAGGANCIYRGADCGTVFSVTTSGKETVLHSFKGAPKDGQNPDGGLIYVVGKLYGTTTGGGHSPCDPSQGCGTAFALTLSGAETVLHSFGDGADGVAPQSALIDVNGMLYGTTPYGGKSGWGTLFEISTSGKERVLHRFNGGAGYYPVASLINVNSTLYGTSTAGGWGYCGSDGTDPGCGIVFALTP